MCCKERPAFDPKEVLVGNFLDPLHEILESSLLSVRNCFVLYQCRDRGFDVWFGLLADIIKFAEGLCPKKLHYPAEEIIMLRQMLR